jgi:hypothetical protein
MVRSDEVVGVLRGTFETERKARVLTTGKKLKESEKLNTAQTREWSNMTGGAGQWLINLSLSLSLSLSLIAESLKGSV